MWPAHTRAQVFVYRENVCTLQISANWISNETFNRNEQQKHINGSTHIVNGEFINGEEFHIIEYRLKKRMYVVRALILCNETLQCKTNDDDDDNDMRNYGFQTPAIKMAKRAKSNSKW